jgi:cellulose synthase/poly-beta-1,6-N-acetylglucosamine synthase-like glycosyltransferase
MKNQIINWFKVLSLLLINMLMLNSRFIMLLQKFIHLVKLLVISTKVFLKDKITCLCHFSQYEMDVNSAFLNDKISELVYVEQSPSFEDSKKPNIVYKLSMTLCLV